MTAELAPITHDHRCEQDLEGKTTADRKGDAQRCGCLARREAKRHATQYGQLITVSDYEVAREHHVGMVIDEAVHRGIRSLLTAVAQAGRVPLITTLHIVGQNPPAYNATADIKFAVLTVPSGAVIDTAMLEVADDWMSARGLRR